MKQPLHESRRSLWSFPDMRLVLTGRTVSFAVTRSPPGSAHTAGLRRRQPGRGDRAAARVRGAGGADDPGHRPDRGPVRLAPAGTRRARGERRHARGLPGGLHGRPAAGPGARLVGVHHCRRGVADQGDASRIRRDRPGLRGDGRGAERRTTVRGGGGRWHGGRVAQRGGRRVVDDPDGGRRPGPGAGGADRERSRVQHRGAGARWARRQCPGSACDVRGDRRLVRAGRGGARRRAAKPPATRRTGCLTRGKGFGPSGAHALALVPMSEQQSPQTATDDGQADLPEQIRVRRDKRDRLLAEGVQPYPVTVPRSHTLAEIRKTYDTQELEPDTKTGETVSVTGRVIFLRNTGKLCFVRLREGDGTELQVMLSLADVGEASLAEFKSTVDLGDLLTVDGEVVTSRRGELSVQATAWGLAAKTLRPLPNEHNPLGEETRARLRYVDLIMRPEAREMVRTKAAVLKSLRGTLDGQGFTEVETPVLQFTNGGAAARPFRTHLNAFDQPMLLRIALELDLKRAMIGGVDRVYEIGRTFRNEGLDSTHAAEFSMLEAYQAYGDYNTMAELARTLVLDAARAVGRTVVPARDGSEIDLEEEWRRLPVLEAVSTAVGEEITTSTSAEELIKIAAAHDVELVP